ncbi:protein RIK-like isoform X1 [Triticum urartu]|uniref:Protein RIK n=3 Tax=Triticum urartu TaxID=4572 RepID=A0A8R7U8G1_TRIUA|nr:protein RIK-like isoform X1 [Triticum urartu]XP_048572037.1 protein RIK-like isoform X1 [Triticum urartu]
MTEERISRASDEPPTATKQRKKRKWDQPAEDLVAAAAAAAAAAGLPVLNVAALAGVQFPGTTAYPAAPYALPPQLAPSVLQSAAAAIQKLSQAKLPDELIAREVVINDADPSVRYKLTKRQTQDEIQRCTCTVIITRGKYHPPNGQPDGEKPLYLHISAGSQLKDTAERIKAVDLAASMIEDILKHGQMPEATSANFPSIQSNRQAVPFSASIFLGFDADPSLNVAARIRGPNDQYINHIMNETGVTVVLRGKDSGNLGNCHAEASQQPLHIHLSGVHLKSLEAAKVLAENLLDTIAAELGASRISSSKVYGAVPPPQQLLTGVHTSGTSDMCVSTGASHSFAPTGVTSPIAAPSVTLQSGAPTYSGILPPSNLIYPSQAANHGAFYNGYGDIYPQATPLQQVALTLKHASSSTTQVIPVASTSTSMTTSVNTSTKLEADKRSQRRKFQELPTADLQNSQQGSKFVKTGLDDLGKMNSSSVAATMKVQPGSNRILPQDPHPSHPSVYTSMPPPPPPKNMSLPYPNSMPPPPPRSMPPPPPKFPSNEVLRNENRHSAVKELLAPPRSSSAAPPPKEPKEEKPSSASVSDTLLKLMDYGDDDEEDDD